MLYIDLVANATPLTKPPYRHYLVQNTELENQLNDLLSKLYSRPNKSLWGALVYFT